MRALAVCAGVLAVLLRNCAASRPGNPPPPGTQKYQCINGVCNPTPDGYGIDLATCEAIPCGAPPTQQLYKCTSNQCTESDTGSSLANCQQVCHAPTPPAPVAVDDPLLQFGRRRLYHAYAAYCEDTALRDWSCEWCDKLPQVTNVGVITSSSDQAYVAIAKEDGEDRVLITFRGSSDLMNWIANINFIAKKLPWEGAPENAKVHEGFLGSYLTLRDDLMAALTKAQGLCAGCPVHITGHSLGASEAVLCATDLFLTKHIKVARVFTFGLPRTGNPEFSNWYASAVAPWPANTRMVHYKDPVPHLPPDFGKSIFGTFNFQHVPRELWQTEESGGGTFVLCNDLNGAGEDHRCSWQYNYVADLLNLTDFIADHTRYYGIHAKLTNPCGGPADGPPMPASPDAGCRKGELDTGNAVKNNPFRTHVIFQPPLVAAPSFVTIAITGSVHHGDHTDGPCCGNTFTTSAENASSRGFDLVVQRTDKDGGWGQQLFLSWNSGGDACPKPPATAQ